MESQAKSQTVRPHSALTYRPDIDGLRAVAVLSVIVFHAFPHGLPGGFVGVDIFFVISGFLITSIILEADRPAGPFLSEFYERRVRRLIPAAVPVILLTLLVGWLVMPSSDLRELAQSAVAYAVFVSNWFFLGEAGYFDGPSEFKPLLHTWSLSVEEQFYLIVPGVVLLMRPLRRWAVPLFFAVLVIGSFGLGAALSRSGQADAAFFNSFARFWEIGIGGLLAALTRGGVRLGSPVRHALSAAGLAGIVAGLVLITNDTPFPGPMGLLPVLGAAALILAGQGLPAGQTAALPVANRLLALRPVVAVGLISYALYLWHWPIFVFLRFIFGNPGVAHYLAGTALTFALATLSYFVVETPFRKRRVLPKRRAAYAGFAASSAVVLGAAVLTMNAGAAPQTSRDGRYAKYNAEHKEAWRQVALRGQCWVDHRVAFGPVLERCVSFDLDRPNVLVVGDSHAAHLMPGLVSAFSTTNFSLLAVDSCTLKAEAKTLRPACTELRDWLRGADLSGFDAVVISMREASPAPRDLAFLEALGRDTPALLIGPVQYYQPNQPALYEDMYRDMTMDAMSRRFDRAVQDEPFALDAELAQAVAGHEGLAYVSSIEALCPERKCRHFAPDGKPMFLDNSHLGLAGSRTHIDLLVPALSDILVYERAVPVDPDAAAFRAEASLADWEVQTGGDAATVDGVLRFSLKPDGRLRVRFDMPETDRPVRMKTRMVIESDLRNAVALDLIMQNGCESVVSDGRGELQVLQPGRNEIVETVDLGVPDDCGMLRLWSRNGQAFQGRMTEFSVSLSER